MGVTYKYISNYVGTCDNKLNQSRLNMLQSKLRRRSINLDNIFVVILDALIQFYSLPLYPMTDQLHGVENYCQVGVYSHHKEHDTRADINSV